VLEFVRRPANQLGISLKFESEGINEIEVVEKIDGSNAPALNLGEVVVKVDPRYFRPSEAEIL
jgi:GDPmannose 4,6-dehydratase